MKVAAYLSKYFEKMHKNMGYRIVLWLFGFLTLIPVTIINARKKKSGAYYLLRDDVAKGLDLKSIQADAEKEAELLLKNRNAYFDIKPSDRDFAIEVEKEAKRIVDEQVEYEIAKAVKVRKVEKQAFGVTFKECISSHGFFIFSLIVSLPMYLLLVIYSNPYTKYIQERLVMLVFVLFGVVVLTFTIIYVSPMDAAVNILGQSATEDNIASFNETYGLDKPYLVQLGNSLKNLATFNLGRSFSGKEDIGAAIARRFPTTMTLAFSALAICLSIGIPAGIVSAIKQYSSLDYLMMFIALLGLSIPSFWLGLMLILTFAIRLQVLPATFVLGNNLSLLMPAVVLGTMLSANIARMTRSSFLEVKKQDFINTARAKGLPEKTVIFRHMIGNAIIPIITIAGIQIGYLMAGSMVIERVFNINGIGSYVVDRQFVPDNPAVLAGVVYFSFVISIANLLVDLIYSFLDPRIKARMKSY